MKTRTRSKAAAAEPHWRALFSKAIKEVGHNELARRMGIARQRLSWIVTSQKAPPSGELAVALERATDGKIKRSDIRPDLFTG